MPTSRPEKFTVIQTNSLAQSRIFPTENEPIFRCRRLGLKPERGAHFAGIQTKANSQHAIQKTGVNRGSGHADQGAPPAIPFLRSPDPLQKIKKRRCAPTAQITSGGRTHPRSYRYDLVADERFGWVTSRTGAS